MLGALFAGLTKHPQRGRALFGTLVAVAREPGWYVEGEVPDSLDGRFRVLATVLALAIVRLEAGGPAAQQESVALTECFVEAMDNEHRQLGIGDPTLGKTVRKLVGSLGRRVVLWRDSVGMAEWSRAVADSLYRDATSSVDALRFSEDRLRALWSRLERASDAAITEGALA
jgi:cytochrome b pre-mRNA-processing protein 3